MRRWGGGRGPRTPRRQESVERLATWMPCGQAAERLAFLTGGPIAAATGRRVTEGAGAADAAVPTATGETIERKWPLAPPGPRGPRLSGDGALVPRQHQRRAQGLRRGGSAPRPPVEALAHQLKEGSASQHCRLRKTLTRTLPPPSC
jgi:hypothetical protein